MIYDDSGAQGGANVLEKYQYSYDPEMEHATPPVPVNGVRY